MRHSPERVERVAPIGQEIVVELFPQGDELLRPRIRVQAIPMDMAMVLGGGIVDPEHEAQVGIRTGL